MVLLKVLCLGYCQFHFTVPSEEVSERDELPWKQGAYLVNFPVFPAPIY